MNQSSRAFMHDHRSPSGVMNQVDQRPFARENKRERDWYIEKCVCLSLPVQPSKRGAWHGVYEAAAVEWVDDEHASDMRIELQGMHPSCMDALASNCNFSPPIATAAAWSSSRQTVRVLAPSVSAGRRSCLTASPMMQGAPHVCVSCLHPAPPLLSFKQDKKCRPVDPHPLVARLISHRPDRLISINSSSSPSIIQFSASISDDARLRFSAESDSEERKKHSDKGSSRVAVGATHARMSMA